MKRSNTFSWLDATKFVLSKSEEAMCQTQILQKISDLGLKDTRVPNSGELVMRALLANSTGKNPIICKVEDKKFVINDNYKSAIFNHDNYSSNRRQLPQRKKAKIISEDFVDSDSVFEAKDDKISYSPYSTYNVNFHHVRKNKRMRTRPAVSVPRISVKPTILLKDSVNLSVQPSEANRAAVQDMLNGNSDIMKYDGIIRKCLNMEEFLKLSKCQQRYLATLLPVSDVRKDRSNIKLAPSALSNPFFASFFREWHDKLCKGELSVDFKAKIQAETDRQVAKDPWKESFFEDVWGFSRAEAMKSKKKWPRQRHDSFEDDIKDALCQVPLSFLMAPVQEPIQDTLTPPTSDSSEHDRSSQLLVCNGSHLGTDSDLNILTPDHEPALTPPDGHNETLTPAHNQSGEQAGEDGVVAEPTEHVMDVSNSSDFFEGARDVEMVDPTSDPPGEASPAVLQSEKEENIGTDTIGPCSPETLTDEQISLDQLNEELELSSAPTSPCLDDNAMASPVGSSSNNTVPCEESNNTPAATTTSLDDEDGESLSKDSAGSMRDSDKESWSESHPKTVEDATKFISDLDLDLDYEESDSIMADYDVEKQMGSLDDLDDPDLNFDFINDRTCNVSLHKSEEVIPVSKSNEDQIPAKTITKLAVSDDISLNIMNEIKHDLAMPEKAKPQEKKKQQDAPKMLEITQDPPPNVLNYLKSYNSPSNSSSSTTSSPKIEQKERVTLKISKKDLLLSTDNSAPPVKKHKSRKHKSKHIVPDSKGIVQGVHDPRVNMWQPGYTESPVGPMPSPRHIGPPPGYMPYPPHMLLPPGQMPRGQLRPGQMQSHPGQMSLHPSQIAVRPAHMPPNAGQVPIRPGQIPIRPGQMPLRPGQMSVQGGHMTIPPGHIPVHGGHMPVTPGHVPVAQRYPVPASGARVPSAGQMIPQSPQKPPVNTSPSSGKSCEVSPSLQSSPATTRPTTPSSAALLKQGRASPYPSYKARDSVQFNAYSDEEAESELKSISLQQQLLAEKGIKSSCVPVEQTQSLVKNMREKQANQGSLSKPASNTAEDSTVVLDSGSQKQKEAAGGAKYPSKSPGSARPGAGSENTDSIRSALKAKISQRRYSDLPSTAPPYPTQSSGNHCCYVVKGCPGECVCSTAPMLFCTKCYHLSHSSCSNVLCSNCGALFKFN